MLAWFANHAETMCTLSVGVTRGQLQALQLNLSKWAAMAGLMCDSQDWWGCEALLAGLSQQAAAGVRPELLKLMQIPGMTAANARYIARKCNCLLHSHVHIVCVCVTCGQLQALQMPGTTAANARCIHWVTIAQLAFDGLVNACRDQNSDRVAGQHCQYITAFSQQQTFASQQHCLHVLHDQQSA